jgi:hypothetical protein
MELSDAVPDGGVNQLGEIIWPRIAELTLTGK